MFGTRIKIAAAGALVGAMGLPAAAQTTEQRIAAMEAEIQQLKTQSWMEEQQQEQVRDLIREVLADAETRAALQEGGVSAGINEKGDIFFKGDGFEAKLGAHLQVRYIWNSREEDGAIDEDVAGFQIRRAKLKAKGKWEDPGVYWGFSLAGDRDDAEMLFEDYYAGWEISDGLKVRAGRFKQPFARVNLTSSTKQQTVERSLANEFFNVDRSEGIEVEWALGEMFLVRGAFNDGIDAELSDFDENVVDFGVTGRVDVKLAGDWKQADDFTAWSGQPFGAFVGGAVHYQEGESDSAFEDEEVLLLTADGSIETGGLNVFGAVYYSDPDGGASPEEAWGFEASAGFNIDDTFEPFGRYEFIDIDGGEEISVLTFGVNYYQKKHDSKFTVDVVYAFDEITALDPSTGLGLLDDAAGEDGQFAVRAQYQFAF